MVTEEEFTAMQKQFTEDRVNMCASKRKEYVFDDNVFDNFERVGNSLGIPREKILLVYLLKHIDGIVSYIREGKTSEDMATEKIEERIADACNYLDLLHSMVSADDNEDEYDDAYGSEGESHNASDSGNGDGGF